jgi:hypothetical protein
MDCSSMNRGDVQVRGAVLSMIGIREWCASGLSA